MRLIVVSKNVLSWDCTFKYVNSSLFFFLNMSNNNNSRPSEIFLQKFDNKGSFFNLHVDPFVYGSKPGSEI